jgi:hypothetical protein
MKAEHRKELETNVLADRMGRVVQGMKQAPQKKTLLYVILGAAVVAALWLYFRKGEVQQVENSLNWMKFEDGSQPYVLEVMKEAPDSNQAKAIHFNLAYYQLRQMLRLLASDPKRVVANLDNLEEEYRKLAETVKDDKVLLPEARFHQAVILETRILKEDDSWKAAREAYKLVADSHPESAFGKLAKKRVDVLDNQEKRDKLLDIYRDLRLTFVPEDRSPPDLKLPPGHSPLDRSPLDDVPRPKLPVPGGDK